MSTVTPTLMTGHITRREHPSSRNQRDTTNCLFREKGQAGRGSGAVPHSSGRQPSYRSSRRWLPRRAGKTRHQHHG